MDSTDNVGRKTIAMVLAGGKGERLSPLTLRRAEPTETSNEELWILWGGGGGGGG